MGESSSAAGSTDSRIEAALREYLERIDRGEALDRELFLSQHPAIADRLRSLIEAEEILRKMGETGRAHHRGNEPTQSFALHTQETIAPQGSAGRAAKECEESLPREFGRYKLLRILGHGAMGTVYLAEDTQLQRHVALKTPQFEKDPTPDLIERFYREARAAACLRHPNTCPVYDVGQIDGTHYITMAYIEGHSLSAFIGPDKPQQERQVLIVVRKLAQALQEAHEHGIVHRDLKPANIMIDTRNEPIIMDFGLARRVRGDDNIKLTQNGMLIGTPAYMSPEQVDGEPGQVGPATDQYSLGVILYELLTGTLPFRGSVTGVLGQILTKQAPPPSQFRSGLDPRIEAVCLKMLAKNPAERFGSLNAVAEELATILRTPRMTASGDDPAKSGPHPSQSGHHAAVDRAGGLHPATSGVLRAPKPLTSEDLASLEELVHKCMARHDYDQVVQIVERIPEEQRTVPLTAMLERARSKADEIAFLICEIDEATRFENRAVAIRKARQLLAIKPGHHRALEVLEQSTESEQEQQEDQEKAAPVHWTHHSTERARKESWIPWAALAFGLAVFAIVSGGIFVYLNRSADSQDVADLDDETADLNNAQGQEQKEARAKELVAKMAPAMANPPAGAAIGKAERRIPPTLGAVARAAATSSKARPQSDAESHKPEGAAPLVAPFDESTAKRAQQEWSDQLKTPIELTNTIGTKLRLIPPGRFRMGSDAWGNNTKPAHAVQITRPFYLGTNEVTRGQFGKFVAATHFKTKAEQDEGGNRPDNTRRRGKWEANRQYTWRHPGFEQDDSHPVVNVSWNDAREFCAWLSRAEGHTYRLPTEAEWEYACRAGTTKLYYDSESASELTQFGNVPDASAATKFPAWRPRLNSSDGFIYTSPVGQFRPNNFGLNDMLGNVFEWCSDWYDAGWYEHSPESDPAGPPSGKNRIARGGSFASYTESSGRWSYGPDDHVFDLGFRVLCEISSDSPRENTETVESTLPAAAAPAKAKSSPEDADSEVAGLLVAPFDEPTAKNAQQEWSERLNTPVELTNSIGMSLRLIPPGQFQMGWPRGSDFTMPEHRVRITRPFYLGACEVTRGQFAKFIAATHYKTTAETDNGGYRIVNASDPKKWEKNGHFTWRHPGFSQEDTHPVINVTWLDAQEFCKWLSRTERKHYRLPTEAEWEYTARAGTTTHHYNGHDPEKLTEIGNLPDATSHAKFPQWPKSLTSSDGFLYTSPVGNFRPNSFGLHDMFGNAIEWCSDWYDADYYKHSPERDPQGPSSGEWHSARGGSFAAYADAGSRWHFTPTTHIFDLGFRVVCDTLSSAPSDKQETAEQNRDDHRRLWKGSQSSFENVRPGIWHASVTIFKKRVDGDFSEMSRTARAVYLIDRTRGTDVRIRLTNEQVFVYIPGKGAEYRPVDKGKWQ